MENLIEKLDNLNKSIVKLEIQIQKAKVEAGNNIKPLKYELAQVKENKRKSALKNDFDSVQNYRRKEDNLKFKIDAQWNKYSLLKDDLTKLIRQKSDLEIQIKLEEDKIKRNNEIKNQMDKVLKNYKKTQDLEKSAIDSNINPNNVCQWYDWGKNGFNETYAYFYNQIIEIDNYFKDLEAQKIINEMDRVIEAYKKNQFTGKSCKISKCKL